MNIQEKLKLIGQTDPQGRIVAKNVPEKFLGELSKEINNFLETTKGNHGWSLIYNIKTDKLELVATCDDVYGKPINSLCREIEDIEEAKGSIKEFILTASENNFKEKAKGQILEILAKQELDRVYTKVMEEMEAEATQPAKKTAARKSTKKDQLQGK